MTINPRSYRHRIRIFAKNEMETNAMNEIVPGNVLHCERWARLKTQGAREVVAANQTLGERSHRFITQSDEKTRAITPKMILQHGGRQFEIVGSWDMDGLRHEVVIDCKEIV